MLDYVLISEGLLQILLKNCFTITFVDGTSIVYANNKKSFVETIINTELKSISEWQVSKSSI